MNTNKQFISIDWGTTNFRCRLVERDSGNILRDYTSDQGILKTYDAFLKQDALSQIDYFADYLRSTITNIQQDIIHLPILLSGMASSTIGLKELPYAEFPIHTSGESLKWEKVDVTNELDLILISGVKSNTGMMRGEEIQAIGLAEFMNHNEKSILVLPGTHSKHMTYENGVFTELRNYMTGELFDVLSDKSILAKSVQKSDMDDLGKSHFLHGLDKGVKENLSANLLTVRANDVIYSMPSQQNYHFLSGLIIGSEIKDFVGGTEKLYLAANEPLFSVYKLALEHICSHDCLSFFDEAISDQALIKGQLKVLRQYER